MKSTKELRIEVNRLESIKRKLIANIKVLRALLFIAIAIGLAILIGSIAGIIKYYDSDIMTPQTMGCLIMLSVISCVFCLVVPILLIREIRSITSRKTDINLRIYELMFGKM